MNKALGFSLDSQNIFYYLILMWRMNSSRPPITNDSASYGSASRSSTESIRSLIWRTTSFVNKSKSNWGKMFLIGPSKPRVDWVWVNSSTEKSLMVHTLRSLVSIFRTSRIRIVYKYTCTLKWRRNKRCVFIHCRTEMNTCIRRRKLNRISYYAFKTNAKLTLQLFNALSKNVLSLILKEFLLQSLAEIFLSYELPCLAENDLLYISPVNSLLCALKWFLGYPYTVVNRRAIWTIFGYISWDV